MAKATHRVGFRHFTYGEWREPGQLVDASSWPNRLVLEEQGYLKPLSEKEAGLEASAPPAGAKRKAAKQRPKASARPPQAPQAPEPPASGPAARPPPAPPPSKTTKKASKKAAKKKGAKKAR
jgi:hypothetical protein